MIFDYHCSFCGEKFERFVKSSDKDSIECPDCHKLAKRVVSPPHFKLDGTDPAFPTAYDRWAKQHETEGRKNRNPS